MSISPTTSRPSTPSRPASRKCSLAIESPTTDCTGNNPLKAFLIYSNDNDHNSNNKGISSRSSSSSSSSSSSTNSHSHSSHANNSDVTNLQPESNIETSIRLLTDDDKTSKKGPFPQNSQLQHHYAALRSISSHNDSNDFKNFKNFNDFNDFNNCSNTTKKKNNTHNIKRPQLAKCASVPSFKYDHLFDNNNYYYHNQPHFHYGNRRISICDLDNFSEEIDLYKDNCSFMERERENNNNNNNRNRNKQEDETRNSHARLVDDNWPNMYELDTALNDHTEYYYKDNDGTSRRNSVKSDSDTLKMDSNTPKQLHHDFHSRNHRRRKSIALKFEEPKIL